MKHVQAAFAALFANIVKNYDMCKVLPLLLS